jgi:hypothetical protein
MARPLSELQVLLKGLDGVQDAYVQAPTNGMEYPCIMIERGQASDVKHADNTKYLLKKAYTLTIIDRAPDSSIPDLVEGLPLSRYDRYFRVNGLNHFVFQMFF